MKIVLAVTIDEYVPSKEATDQDIQEDIANCILDGMGFPEGMTVEALLIGKFWDGKEE